MALFVNFSTVKYDGLCRQRLDLNLMKQKNAEFLVSETNLAML